MPQGLFLIYTGNGKGKTSAALGQAVRALGHGWNVALIQFIKSEISGEISALEQFGGNFFHDMQGEGFTWQGDREKHRESARKGWNQAAACISSGDYSLVILDELTYTISEGYISLQEVLSLVKDRPSHVNLVVTGRDAPAELVAEADMVSEINQVKHHFAKGVKAQKGIEF